MLERDRQVVVATYRSLVELGRVPTAAEVAVATGMDAVAVRSAWTGGGGGHLVVGEDGELVMAIPFSALPTPHRVRAAGRWWWANCAWDALGVCAALGVDGDVETTCPDCGDHLAFGVRDRRPTEPTLVFHCLVPAAAWWDETAFT